VNRELRFVKMHGAGNDFVMIDCMEERLSLDAERVAAICERHRGIGADGLILLEPSRELDFTMRYYNSDGGEAEMCGNGARCAALFARLSNRAADVMTFETIAGPVHAVVNGGMVTIGIGDVVEVRMGIEIEGSSGALHYAVSGVPHAVLIHEDAKGVPSNEFVESARAIRFHPRFATKGTNVDFVSISDRNHLYLRTYERGVEAETLACGTGAVASAVITTRLGLTSSPVVCETSGGDVLEVAFEITDAGARDCRLTGPAAVAFSGSFVLEMQGDT
jgi:diaminopimelate epimerase